MKLPCDCCEGVDVLTPLPTANRPGLSTLRYRVGTHGAFFETMRARLSSVDFPELAALKTRERSDPAMALLDAWATAGDVLTFYQERIANEGYLRTATERRSILEQARLVGYRLRPGVAASVYLAYTIENNSLPVEIPRGAKVNSIPAPGEEMQAFETSEPLEARPEWNALKPRMAQPQTPQSIVKNGLYLEGTASNLKPNDPLLVDFGIDGGEPAPLRVHEVKPDNKAGRTQITLRDWEGHPLVSVEGEPLLAMDHQQTEMKTNVDVNKAFLDKLKAPPSIPPANAKQLARSVKRAFAAQAETFPKLMSVVSPRLSLTLYPALRNAEVTEKPEIKVYAFRKSASLFGHNAPKEPRYELPIIGLGADIPSARAGAPKRQKDWCEWMLAKDEKEDRAYLDTVYEQVGAGSYAVIESVEKDTAVIESVEKDTGEDGFPKLRKIKDVVSLSRAEYGITGKTSRLTFETEWWDATKVPEPPDGECVNPDNPEEEDDFKFVRTTIVHCQSEELALAEEPVHKEICGREIELEGIYEGLEPGRWIIISGERSDIPGTAGVAASELVMLAEVTQKTQTITSITSPKPEPGDEKPSGRLQDKPGTEEPLPGDKLHTYIRLDTDLAYCYRRDSVTLHANVVKATHGETRREILGSGDASKAFQSFELKQFPLTYVSAPTASGIESTLEARVNDIKWHEAGNLAALGAHDRKFITSQDDDEKTTITFGNGKRGARLPTGQENITAVYRGGIGKPGNVRAGQISLLATRPLGVKAVVNPIRSSGGADTEGRDQARKNAPLALLALDRLVSTSDYADFTRTFAGIGKAAALRSTSGRQHFVQVTIAGAEDIPIEETSDLYRNLNAALRRYGDPHLPIRINVRERLALVISANVRIHPDYLWEVLEPRIRSAMLEAFGFENLELGEDLLLAEAVRVIQRIPGVVYVDVDVFDKISEAELLAGFSASGATEPNEGASAGVAPKLLHRIPIESSQLAYLAPEVPDTLILQEIKA